MLEGPVSRVLLAGAISAGVLTVAMASPAGAEGPSSTTVSTVLSDGTNSGTSLTESVNSTVTDSAALAGAGVSTAGGTVTYLVFSDSTCAKVVDDSQVTVTDGVVPPSAPETLSKPGTYYWTAVYSGDSANAGSVEACGSEIETVVTGTVVNTATDSATCQASGDLSFDPPLVSGGTAAETATLSIKLKGCTVSGTPAVDITGATWKGTVSSSEDGCSALDALSPLSSTLAFKTTPAMRSDVSDVVFNSVLFSGNTLGDTGALANADAGTAPFEGSDQGTSSGFSLTTSVTATQAATTCSKKSKGLKSLKIAHGVLSLQ
jgi:hypothetical protein